MEETKMIRSVTLVGVLGNILLTAFKFFAGIAGRSAAMISDAVHSLSDVIATLIAFFGSVLSRRPADQEHPYGHERIESVASLFLGLILAVTGLEIFRSGMHTILSGDYDSLRVPGTVALVAAVTSIVTKELMYRYTRFVAEKLSSPVFMADAWHHRSDALSSIGSLAGIAGSMLGLPVLDSVAGVVISLFILKVAYDIAKGAIQNMMDTSAGTEYEEKICSFVAEQPGVERVDLVHTRMFGSKVYVDLEIGVDESITVREGHDIAERVHDLVEQHFREVKHIMVHVNPFSGQSQN
ncbi:MAG: cation diffusion facilitator family transporter [Lachnospiraceae bacterium]|nr:cation diffusion facilitator family transporter [Lachnospiraceae bacterium]